MKDRAKIAHIFSYLAGNVLRLRITGSSSLFHITNLVLSDSHRLRKKARVSVQVLVGNYQIPELAE
jgi:hypothetical protein